MCIAIVKPKGANFPTMKQLENCFTSNPHGAGFMYSDGENLILKKGFMTFESFKKAYLQENISKDKLVFFHFRIATHGLKDGGNTHPFPLVKDAEIMRETSLKFKGYGMIHNGVISYQNYEFNQYGGSNYISDTMLFGMKVAERLPYKYKTTTSVELAVAAHIKSKNNDLIKYIEHQIHYNKIAIMNEHEEYVKYGQWIEDNGVFYSNDDYDYDCNYNYYSSYYNNGLECCACCQEYVDESQMVESTYGFVCKTCAEQFEMIKCESCGILMLKEDAENTNLCDVCNRELQESECDMCGETINNNEIYMDDKDNVLCKNCYLASSYYNSQYQPLANVKD
jgi:predicted glutamine amidotransferase